MPGPGRGDPERTCVGCRSTAPKRSLLRVGTARGEVVLDRAGRVAGRGAYLHRDRACVDRGVRPAVLARALRRGVGPDEVGRLRERIDEELGDA